MEQDIKKEPLYPPCDKAVYMLSTGCTDDCDGAVSVPINWANKLCKNCIFLSNKTKKEWYKDEN